MGRPDGVYPEALAGERDCLNCERPFTPARSGWQAHYCTLACWRANNGGPRRHQAAYRPRPAVVAIDRSLPRAEVEQREAFVQEVAAALDQATDPPSRLVVVGTEHYPHYDTTHQVYGYLEVPGAPR